MADKPEKKKQKPQPSKDAAPAPTFGVLIELETVALPGRKQALALLGKSMAAAGLKPPSHASLCRHAEVLSPGRMVSGMLNEGGGESDVSSGVASAFEQAMDKWYTSPACTLAPGVKEFIGNARRKHFAVCMVSLLPEEKARALVARMGLGDDPPCVIGLEEEIASDYPNANHWMRAAAACGCVPRGCVAVVSSRTACRGALTAGMRCVAVPDEFTEYHDFSGAEYVLESVKECDLENIKALMSPHQE